MSNGIIRVTLSDGTTPPDYLEYGISLDAEVFPENSQLSNEFTGLENAVYYIFYRRIGENWDADNFLTKTLDFPISYVALKIDDILEAVEDAETAAATATTKAAEAVASAESASSFTRMEIITNEIYDFAIIDPDDNVLFGIKKNAEVDAKIVIAEQSILLKHLSPSVVSVLPMIIENIFASAGQFAIVDADDNILAEITDEGKLKALFDFSLSKIKRDDIDKLVTDLLPYFSNAFASAGQFAIVDADDNILAEITDEGKLKALFDFSLSKITSGDISDSLKNLLITEVPDNDFLDYHFCILDADDNVLVGLRKNGQAVLRLSISEKSISSAMLADEVNNRFPSPQLIRENTYNQFDFEITEDDDLFRGNEVELPVRTNRTGYGFSRLSPIRTNAVRGVNTTGTALEFRNGDVLTIRGERYVGDYATIPSTALVNYKGWYRNSEVTLPSSPVTGDFYLCVFFYLDAKTRTVGGVTMSEWDILYWNGTAWMVQASPATSANLRDGDFWNITSNGKFWNVSVKSGDRLVFLGTKTGGGWNEPIWVLQKAGEYYCMGECNPASFSPATTRDFDLYVVSVDGTFSGIDLKKGDYLIRNGGCWGKSSGNLVTIANNTCFSIPCTNAKQISIRRADKSVTQVDLKTKVSYAIVNRKINNDIVLYSDSMFGVNVGSAISALLTGRTATTQSYGGASTNNLLSMIKVNIRLGDAHKGKLHVFWHGQNNNGDLVQIKSGALEMASLAGIQQSKYVFWSVLGQLIMNFNGTRLVGSNHEDSYNRVNNSRFNEIEDWYDTVFPGKHFSPRKAALAAAVGRTRKSLQYPGMSEAQAAATYGIPPFSFFFNFSSVIWNPDNLVFLGYHNTAGLPTGGNENDYYIRSGGGTVGQIIVKTAGAWVEYAHDVTHVTAEGGAALAAQFINFLNQNSI